MCFSSQRLLTFLCNRFPVYVMTSQTCLSLSASNSRNHGVSLEVGRIYVCVRRSNESVVGVCRFLELIDKIFLTRETEEPMRVTVLHDIIHRSKKKLVRDVTVRGEKELRLLREGNKAKSRTPGEQALVC